MQSFTIKLIVIAILLTGFSGAAFADEALLGLQAENEGKFRTALTHYVKALQSVTYGSANDIQLREKIIKLALKLQPPPEGPEKAHRYIARGEAFAETANDKDGFQRAGKEFQAAASVAPWMADAYYNLGIMQDKAGLYKQAMQSLEFYLLAAPNASDAREVRNLIYKIEARGEASHIQEKIKAEEDADNLARKKIKALDGGIFEANPEQLSHSGGYWTFKVVMRIQGNNFKLLNKRNGETMFKGTIGDEILLGDISLKGVYIQKSIFECRKDEYGVWIDEFKIYNKSKPMTGWISSDGERMSLRFTSYSLKCNGSRGEGNESVELQRKN